MSKSGKAIRVDATYLTSTGTAFNNLSADNVANIAKVDAAFGGAAAAAGEPVLAAAVEQLWVSWSRELHLTSQVLSEIGTKLGGSAATWSQADTGVANQMVAADPTNADSSAVIGDTTPVAGDPTAGDPIATGAGTTGTGPTAGGDTTGAGTPPAAGGDGSGTSTAPTTGDGTPTTPAGGATTGTGAAPTPGGDSTGSGTTTAAGSSPSAGGTTSATSSAPTTSSPPVGTTSTPTPSATTPASAAVPVAATASVVPVSTPVHASSGFSPIASDSSWVNASSPGNGVQTVSATVPLSAVTTAFDVSPLVPGTGAATSSKGMVEGAIAAGAGIALLAAAMSPWRKTKKSDQRRSEVPPR